jgi:RNA polymerase sigma factor (sigma-70 family)
MPEDYLLKVKVQNNRIIALMKQNKIESVSELHRRTKISTQILHGFINMTESPLMQHSLFSKNSNGDGLWRKSALELADFFGVLPDEMFNEQQLTSPLKTNKAERVIELEQMIALMGPKESLCVEEHRFEEEKQKVIDQVLNTLKPREKAILSKRFGLEEEPVTLDICAKEHNVNRERIRQIETKALRKLRQPGRANKLRDLQHGNIYENIDEHDFKNKVTFVLKKEQKLLLLNSNTSWQKTAEDHNIHPVLLPNLYTKHVLLKANKNATNSS